MMNVYVDYPILYNISKLQYLKSHLQIVERRIIIRLCLILSYSYADLPFLVYQWSFIRYT